MLKQAALASIAGASTSGHSFTCSRAGCSSRYANVRLPGQRQLVVLAATDNKKGFGSSAPDAAPTKASVNKRGKSSSRPGQISKKEMEKKVEEMKAIEAAQEEFASASTSGSGSSTGTVPQVVTDRMLKRILIFTALPIFSGILLLPAFYYLKTVQNVDLPNYIVITIQSGFFGVGLLGISYGILSASWDPAREGSFWGVTEFKANLPIALERFRRR